MPWKRIWVAVQAAMKLRGRMEGNLGEKRWAELQRLYRQALAGPNTGQPWRNVSEKERARIIELTRLGILGSKGR